MAPSDFPHTPHDANAPDPGEDLSATGMFLRSMNTDTAPATQPFEPGPAIPATGPGSTRTDWSTEHIFHPPPSIATPPPAQSKSGPGEFTQMFQALDAPAQEPRATNPTPVQLPSTPKPEPTPAAAPGEFTRVFVSGATPAATPPQVARPEAPPPVQQAPQPKLKGFSSPGVSDSASAEGSFTQFFKASPPAASVSAPHPTPQPTPPPVYQPVQHAPVFTPPAPPSEKEWTPNFAARQTAAMDAPPPSPSATGLLSSLAAPSTPPASHAPEPVPYRPEPLPAYTPAPPPSAVDASSLESGSVTRLIQRLAQVGPPEPAIQRTHPPVPPPQTSSGPGEFTRMISGETVRNAINTPQPAAAPPQQAPVATPQVPVPQFQMPAVTPPAFHPPAAPPPQAPPAVPAMPKFEAPKFAPPQIAPPTLPAAPKGKLEALVPFLLIVNTFLLLILLVVVIFAMKAK